VSTSAENLKDIWDKLSEWWIKTVEDNESSEYVEIIVPLIEGILSEKKTILDIGTGTGLVAQEVRRVTEHATIVGGDISIRQLRYAKEVTSGIQFVQHSIDHMPFKDEKFDAVVCSMVLEHIESLLEAVSEIARILEKGGIFLIIMNHPVFQSPGSGPATLNNNDRDAIWGIGDYLTESSELEKISPDLEVLYSHRTIATYFNALSNQNLIIQNVIEKSIPSGLSGIPELLIVLCRKVQ
tara:strand:- start:1000 stop:1716 length:717 start_codon:yes stop_codon:yes gene_type:complete